MNIFLIPSWYPDENNYVQGIFIREQFTAMAEFNSDSNFIISNVVNFNLPLKKPSEAKRSLNTYSTKKKFVTNELNTNLLEINNPVLTWTEKLKGNISRQVNSHIENFLFAKEKYGNIDLIHAHVSFPAGYIAMKLKEKFNLPYIITEHMGPFPFQHFLKNGKLSQDISDPLKGSDKIIAVSSSLAKTIKSYVDIMPEVIPNMANENIFNPGEKQNNKNKITFLTVTSLIESKGIQELLEAAKISIAANTNIEFIIAGNGSMDDDVRSFIKDNNLSGNIFLHTALDRNTIVDHFKQCDAYILPSKHESFGISYIEAMACGKPVIATDCGGPGDFVNNDNGKLVQIGNIKEISNAILSVADNIKSYDPNKIREFFMKNFSRGVVCSKIYSAYEEILR